MIIGIGHDLVELDRIHQIMNQPNRAKFLARIFTVEELEQLSAYKEQRLVEYVAGRYALKEAVSKAFGCGIGAKMGFHQINIGKLPTGKPVCTVALSSLQALGYASGGVNIHVTITHERSIASAFVVVEES